jgi:hypothetical protein
MNAVNPYESPKAELPAQRAARPRGNWRDYSPAFNQAMLNGLMIQGALGVPVALILDGGPMLRVFLVAMLGQWSTALIILLRRPTNPTRLDLAMVRYGILPLFIVVLCFGPLLLRMLG